MLRDNEEPRFCRFCDMWLNIGQWNAHRRHKEHRKCKKRGWPLEQQLMKDAVARLSEFEDCGTTSFVVQAKMCFSGREREFKFPDSDAPLWILEYATRAWVLEVVGEEEHYFTGVHLVLEGNTFVDVYDKHLRNPEKIPLSSIFGDVATDGKYDVTVVLDTEKSPRGEEKQTSQHCVSCLLNSDRRY